MRIVFQILQTYTSQKIPCVVLTVDTKKYFFNTPETLLRFCGEHYIKLGKGSSFFFTQVNTEHITGLLPLLSAIFEDEASYGTKFYGPPGLCKALHEIRLVFGRSLLPCSAHAFFSPDEEQYGVNSGALVKKIRELGLKGTPIVDLVGYLKEHMKKSPKDVNNPHEYIKEGGYYKDDHLEIHPILLAAPNAKSSLTYLCKTNGFPGKVIKEKLDEYKVPKNMIKKLLETGEIEIDGKTIKASSVKEPDVPPQVLIIVDCPSIAHIESLANSPQIKALYKENININENNLAAMIHMCPTDVLLSKEYAEILSKLPDTCQHIFINEDFKDNDIELDKRIIEIQRKKKKEDNEEKKSDEVEYNMNSHELRSFNITTHFNEQFPDHFPRLKDLPRPGKYELEKVFPYLNKKIIGRKLVEFLLYPIKTHSIIPLNISLNKIDKLTTHTLGEEFFKRVEKLKARKQTNTQEDIETLKKFEGCDPEMVFLGTGSMRPVVYRNVSAIYLRFWQQGNAGMLLDCGEGTYFQLLQHYGEEKTREYLKNLEVIWISHVHNDHCWGTMRILSERQRVLKEEGIEKEPPYVIIPSCMIALLCNYSAHIEELQFKVIFNNHINIKETGESSNIKILDSYDEAVDDGDTTSTPAFSFYNDPTLPKWKPEASKQSLENVPKFNEVLRKTFGITRFKTLDVDHCPESSAVFMEHENGWRYIYSGDKKPCDIFSKEIGEATILIHEATYSHDFHEHVLQSHDRHSTDRQAIETGVGLKAWRVVLTHFSQRNEVHLKTVEKDEINNEVDFYKEEKTVWAYDHMRSKFSELVYFPYVSKCLRVMLPNDL